jgi:phosphogluconate 2-dehydrogenase
MRVIAIDALASAPDVLKHHRIDFFGTPEDIDKLLAESDYISLHTPLTSKTRHLINERALRLMKPSAVLINVARGEIVDQAALLEALESGKIRGAGLDTFAHEPLDPSHSLLKMSNVVATPHIAGGTRGTLKRRTKAAAENIFRAAKGLPPLYQITSVE